MSLERLTVPWCSTFSVGMHTEEQKPGLQVLLQPVSGRVLHSQQRLVAQMPSNRWVDEQSQTLLPSWTTEGDSIPIAVYVSLPMCSVKEARHSRACVMSHNTMPRTRELICIHSVLMAVSICEQGRCQWLVSGYGIHSEVTWWMSWESKQAAFCPTRLRHG